jgi:hypothetical protein
MYQKVSFSYSSFLLLLKATSADCETLRSAAILTTNDGTSSSSHYRMARPARPRPPRQEGRSSLVRDHLPRDLEGKAERGGVGYDEDMANSGRAFCEDGDKEDLLALGEPVRQRYRPSLRGYFVERDSSGWTDGRPGEEASSTFPFP